MSKRKRTNVHHRFPESLGGTGSFPVNNLIEVDRDEHRDWHTLFQNKTVWQIAAELNKFWLDRGVKVSVAPATHPQEEAIAA